MNLEPHPASEVLPQMNGNELDTLATDIQQHGLIEPIALYEGKVLDGRARLVACDMVGVEPRFVNADLNGRSALEYVVEVNLAHRYMTAPQRAALAMELLPRVAAEAKERQRLSGELYGGGGNKEEVSFPEDGKGKTAKIVGQMVGLGTTTIEKTVSIQKRSPRTIRRMRDGQFKTMAEARADAGFAPSSHDAILKGTFAPAYGKGDKWREATEPIRRYLRGWQDRGYSFRHVNPREAQKRIAIIDEMIEQLEAVKSDLATRSHKATLSVRSD